MKEKVALSTAQQSSNNNKAFETKYWFLTRQSLPGLHDHERCSMYVVLRSLLRYVDKRGKQGPIPHNSIILLLYYTFSSAPGGGFFPCSSSSTSTSLVPASSFMAVS